MNQIPLFAALEIPIKGEYYQLLKPDQKDYKRLIDETFNNPKITLDIETTGLDPIKDKIRLIQFKTVGIARKPF